MNAITVYNELKDKKGQHVLITWERACKTLSGAGGIQIIKRTSAYVRAGINFANLSSVREGIEMGERGEVGDLPWGNWRAGFRPFIIDHIDKAGHACEYIRLYPAVFGNLKERAVEYVMNGVVSNYQQVEKYLLASEKKKEDDKPIECFTVKAESILSIGD